MSLLLDYATEERQRRLWRLQHPHKFLMVWSAICAGIIVFWCTALGLIWRLTR